MTLRAIESFADFLPIEVGVTAPIVHSRGRTFMLGLECEALPIMDLGHSADDARLRVIYDFSTGHILDVSPDLPDLAITGRWRFDHGGRRYLIECWREPGEEGWTFGKLVYSWRRFLEPTSDDRASGRIARQLTVEGFANLGYRVLRKLSAVAELPTALQPPTLHCGGVQLGVENRP